MPVQVQALYKSIKGQKPAKSVGPGYYLIPCNSNVQLQLVFNAVIYHLPPAKFELAADPQNAGFRLGAVSENSSPSASER